MCTVVLREMFKRRDRLRFDGAAASRGSPNLVAVGIITKTEVCRFSRHPQLSIFPPRLSGPHRQDSTVTVTTRQRSIIDPVYFESDASKVLKTSYASLAIHTGLRYIQYIKKGRHIHTTWTITHAILSYIHRRPDLRFTLTDHELLPGDQQ